MSSFTYIRLSTLSGNQPLPYLGDEPAFVTTSEAYRRFLHWNDLDQHIPHSLSYLDFHNGDALSKTSAQICDWVLHGEMPPDLDAEIRAAYTLLEREVEHVSGMVICSRASIEDAVDYSADSWQDADVAVSGVDDVLVACRHVFATLFSEQAIIERVTQGIAHMSVVPNVCVKKPG